MDMVHGRLFDLVSVHSPCTIMRCVDILNLNSKTKIIENKERI